MKLVRFAFRSVNNSTLHPFHPSNITRTRSANPFSDEFESRIFGGGSGNGFFRKLDRLRFRNSPGGLGNGNGEGNDSSVLDGLADCYNKLSDGMNEAAMYFEIDEEGVEKEVYAFRRGTTYDVKDLDLTTPGVHKPVRGAEFEVTTEEVLRKADFSAGISAMAQRKVAREIKTARAVDLVPFTTIGTKSFIFGKTMENRDEDYGYEVDDGRTPADLDGQEPFGV